MDNRIQMVGKKAKKKKKIILSLRNSFKMVIYVFSSLINNT